MPAISSATEFSDPDGFKIKLLPVGETMLIPVYGFEENLKKLKEFKFRDDDVIITAYPRSGTHLVWEIIQMLKQGSPEYIKGEKEMEGLEMFYWNDLPSRSNRVINTHLPPELLPDDYRRRKCKFIHVYRNPKDTMVSLYNHCMNFKELFSYDGKFSGFFELAMKGQVEAGNWMTYELKYETFQSTPDVIGLTVTYEDLKMKPIATIKTISEFLGLFRDDELIASIADAVSFHKMKAGKFQLGFEKLRRSLSNEHYARNYRKGVVGDWKNWFTVSQNERFNEAYHQKMRNSSRYITDI